MNLELLSVSSLPVRILLKHKANNHARDNTGYTALHNVAQAHCGAVTELLRSGAGADDSRCGGGAPLMSVNEIGKAESARVLLKKVLTCTRDRAEHVLILIWKMAWATRR